MEYIVLLFTILMVAGVVGVASSPTPYFAALGLVTASAGACGLLTSFGGSFISLVLVLIYSGGMLVVFAYSATLAAEPYPEAWGTQSVFLRALVCYLVILLGAMLVGVGLDVHHGVVDEYRDFSVVRGDFGGVGFIYCLGGEMLIFCGWALLICLYVVLDLTRGSSRGTLRSV
nr:NADH dehydrogenase subunit 6 [Schultzidia johnstonensis]